MIRCVYVVFFFKQKTAYEMRISDWSSDVCSSDLNATTKEQAHTAGPWLYRPDKYDDWGFVRAQPEQGRLLGGVICQARDPYALDDVTLNAHRRAKTDPWEANARLIAAAPDLLEALQLVWDTYGMDPSVDSSI